MSKMDFQPPKKLMENLDSGETLITGLKNVRLGARPAADAPAPIPAPPSAAPVSDDPLKALQMRFVKGEITKEQYEEMKNFLVGS